MTAPVRAEFKGSGVRHLARYEGLSARTLCGHDLVRRSTAPGWAWSSTSGSPVAIFDTAPPRRQFAGRHACMSCTDVLHRQVKLEWALLDGVA